MKAISIGRLSSTALLLSWALTSCIIYPRLGHVYETPDLRIIVVDSTRQPVNAAKVICEGYPQHDAMYTDVQGHFYLPAHRVFRVLDMLTMDPPVYSFVPVVEMTNGIRFLKTYRYHPSIHKTTISDTLVLNSKSRARFATGKGW